MESDALRPRGTVQVTCVVPGCGIAWWLDPLDPRLPDGPFDCGSDHVTDSLARRRLSMLHLRYGVEARSILPRGPKRGEGACGSASMAAGIASVADREVGIRGVLEWSSLQDLEDPDALLDRIRWGEKPNLEPDAGEEPKDPPPGFIRWVGYKAHEEIRRYTFLKCARPECPHRLMVDVRDPSFQPDMYVVGSWGGGEMPEPSWMKNKPTLVCEQGLSTFAPHPCVLVRSEALARYEQATGSRWTMWNAPTDEQGTLLFWNSSLKRPFGLFTYEDLRPFSDEKLIAQRVVFGTLFELEALLQQRNDGHWDSILSEIQLHTKLAS